MIIPINLAPTDSHATPLPSAFAKLGANEVVLIELQGWLDVVEGEKAGGSIGTLKMQNDEPILIIGHHHLEGKLVRLPKPLAVLERRRKHVNEEAEGGRESTDYDMVTIIKRKITFFKRPVPIVRRT